MKCPNCGDNHLAYNKSRKKHWKGKSSNLEGKITPRIDFTAKCRKCGWEGEIKNE